MEIPEHRRWMYIRKDSHQNRLLREFILGVEKFISAAMELDVFKQEGKFRCPCSKCKCLKFNEPDLVRQHLYQKGFQPNYYHWHNHGETPPSAFDGRCDAADADDLDSYERMVIDAEGPSFYTDPPPEHPNQSYTQFYDLLCAAQSPLWDGCEDHSVLSIAVRLLSIKSDYNIPAACIDEIITLIKEVLPASNRMLNDFYQTKNLVSRLGCGYKKIDCCPSGCMLYYGDDVDVTECRFCGETRFKENMTMGKRKKEIPKKQMWYLPIIPRLQRMFASNVTAKYMTWHHDNRREMGKLSHPSDGEAWKHFNKKHPVFASESRNVRLGLCSDGFSPFNMNAKVYSCWPVILTPYNLPPGMCMKKEYMFLTIIIPGPSSPKSKIDVYLQPLIHDLKILWDEGVLTYDISRKQNFRLKAALCWTINDFPAYGMLSGWSTAGKLGCPICMERSKSFYLKNGKKVCYFDCHRQFLPLDHSFRSDEKNFLKGKEEKSVPPRRYSGVEILTKVSKFPKITDSGSRYTAPGYGVSHHWSKRSIFWDLPYWCDLLNPHNIDVMHTESNIFNNVFNTVMDVKDKTKDNHNARKDLSLYCTRESLELEKTSNRKPVKPKAQYTLNINQKRGICEWVQGLKFPDGYASNLSRCVDLRSCTLQHMKSHDCHVFMERLIPIAFSCLPTPIWESLTDLSYFFRDLCCPVLETNRLEIMDKNIPIILCKLEKIFPPAFFDVMEHLPIHLVYEAIVGGPVQFRWMYPFERFLHGLKKKVKNKARVEGSICEAYVLEETSTFCSHYFESHVQTRNRRVHRNDDGGVSSENPQVSIFNYPGRHEGASKSRYLTDKERAEVSLYVLLNCPEVEPFYTIYKASLRANHPNITGDEVKIQIQSHFVAWFRNYAHNPDNGIEDPFLYNLAWGPLHRVQTYPVYFVNDYCFHISTWAQNRKTNNSGVALTGEESVYHGIIQEMIEIQYPGEQIKRLTLFNCKWFDHSSMGTRSCPIYGVVEVKSNRRYKGKDTFILAQQAEQVYYTPYPNPTPNKKDWFVVIKTKARSTIQSPNVPYQDDIGSRLNEVSCQNDIDVELRDINSTGEEVSEDAEVDEHIEEEEYASSESEESESEEDAPSDYYEYSD